MRNKKEASGLLFLFFYSYYKVKDPMRSKRETDINGGVLFDMDFIKWRKNKQRINIFENL